MSHVWFSFHPTISFLSPYPNLIKWKISSGGQKYGATMYESKEISFSPYQLRGELEKIYESL